MLTNIGLNVSEKWYNTVQYFSPKSQGFILKKGGCLNQLHSPIPQPTKCRTVDQLLTYGVINIKQIMLRQCLQPSRKLSVQTLQLCRILSSIIIL